MPRQRSPHRGVVVLALVGTLSVAGCAATPADSRPGSAASAPVSTAPVSPAPTPKASTPTASTSRPATPSPTASPAPGPGRTPPPTEPTEPTCAELAARLSLDDQVGQLLMVAVSSTGIDDSAAATLADTRAGSALLLGNSDLGLAATRRVATDARRAVTGPPGVRGLVAVDQEGGQVQRLRGAGFDDIPTAVAQARLSDPELEQAAARWGGQLSDAGIDVDLAPVADVVPMRTAGRNAPIGRLSRGYGSDPEQVAAKVVAFSSGMRQAGVVTAVKHFPGLGRVRGNTDFATRVVDSVTTREDPRLAGFRAAVRAGVPMVMVSSAIYRRIDADQQAVFSREVITDMLRGDLGFDGVVISDDLSAAAVRDLEPGRRAVGFVQAGGDLAIVGDLSEAATMADALSLEAGRDPELARQVTRSAARVLALKATQDRADCR